MICIIVFINRCQCFFSLVDFWSSWLFHCLLTWFSYSREVCCYVHFNCENLGIVLIGRSLWVILRLYLVYCYPQMYCQWQYLSYFDCLLQTVLWISDYILLIRRLVFFGCFRWSKGISCVYVSTNSALGLYWSFKVSTTIFIDWLKYPVGIL